MSIDLLLTLLLLFGVVMILNGILMTLDGGKLNRVLAELRKKGEVLSGEQKGLLFLKSLHVMMAVDKRGVIQDAKLHVSGFMRLGKVRDLPFKNKSIHMLPEQFGELDPLVISACKIALRKFA